jgi:dienelactone hydrolase
VDSVAESSPVWRLERVSFAAAYERERVPGLLFLPRNAHPPFQVVIYFPPVNALWERSSANFRSRHVESVVRSGRAFLLPIYKGTYERGSASAARGPAESRERFLRFYQDLARALDYVEIRRDLDAKKVAYFGFSLGVAMGPLFMAVEPRLRTGVFLSGGVGIWPGAVNPYFKNPQDPPIPEIDPMSFAAHVTAPILMVNGLNDFIFPVETSQRPLFDRLGTPPAHKRHAVLPGGHMPDSQPDAMKEILNWLDKYLGPVQR